MTTFLIHTFEVVTLLLVVGKLLQIRKLYKRSVQLSPPLTNSKPKRVKQSYKVPLQKKAFSTETEISKLKANPRLQTFTKSNSLFSFQNLPLPEVTFSINSKKSEAANKPVVQKTEIKPNPEIKPKHQVILNSYIDDLFFESGSADSAPSPLVSLDIVSSDIVSSEIAPSEKEVSKIVASGNYRIDTNQDDEFIVVAEENADLVRAFEASNQKLVYLR